MSTIQQLIQGYAGIYQERPNQPRPELTEMDFLASIARDKAIDSCNPDFYCAFRELELYRANPNAFIDNYLGVRGSTTRILYEHQARAMLHVAQKYSSSADENSTAHPFHREMAEIEARYLQCTLSRGIVEYLSMQPVGETNQRSFARSLETCADQLNQTEPQEVGCSGPLQYDEPYRSKVCCGSVHCR